MVRRLKWDEISLDAGPDESATYRAKKLDHLLKVAASTSRDAAMVWAELWAELKPLVDGNNAIMPRAKEGFLPACGWPEFFEKIWLLKHYLDSTHRICTERQ